MNIVNINCKYFVYLCIISVKTFLEVKKTKKYVESNYLFKSLSALLAVIAIFFGFYDLGIEAHTESTSYSWYFQPTKNNMQPKCLDGAEFLDKYDTIYLGSPESKRLYLTFDAGYEDGNVEKILDILKEEKVPSSFFVLPNLVNQNTALCRRMIDEGHLICNHSFSHKDMSCINSLESFKKEINGLENVVAEKLGIQCSKYFRPPEGKFCENTLKYANDLGYKTVFWSLAYADWDKQKQPDPQKSLELLMSRIHPGSVILLHPTSTTNAAILRDFIKQCRQQGYEFYPLNDFESKSENCENTVSASNQSMEKVVMSNRKAKKRVALTFDDGPCPAYTPQILDYLKNENVKATFFLIGCNAEENPELVRREFNEGHEIGNHTYSHPNVKNISTDRLLSEIEKCQSVIESITGSRPKLFRPPGGFITDNIVTTLTENQFTPVLWSWKQDTKDWSCPSVEYVVNTVLNNINDGDIILFHDYNSESSPTPAALEIIIPRLKDMGYEFCTVSQLMSIT